MSDVPPDPSSTTMSLAVTPPISDVAKQDAWQWAMFCHLSALGWIRHPRLAIVGPLVVWLIKKDEHPFIDEQGKESLNFQISMTDLRLICGSLCCVCIGIRLVDRVLLVFGVVMAIIAAVKANNGEVYRYPMTSDCG